MAQAISKISKPSDFEEKREAARLADVQKQVAVDADGLIESLKLLQAMHDRGVLELLVALFDRGDKVMGKVMDLVSTPGTMNALKVVMAALQGFGSYDPDALTKYLNGFSAGVDEALVAKTSSKALGAFDLLKLLKDPDVSAALNAGLAFLKGAGRAFREAEEKEGEN